MNEEMFEKGMAVRPAVARDKAIDLAMKNADDFNMPMQGLVTEYYWDALSTRPDFDRRYRNILNIGIPVGMGAFKVARQICADLHRKATQTTTGEIA